MSQSTRRSPPLRAGQLARGTYLRVASGPHTRVRSAWAVAVFFVVLSAGCSRARPDFATSPKVVVPIEPRPEQDPTLFQQPPPQHPPVTSDAPDPTPLRMREQVYYEIEFNKGEVRVLSTRRLTLREPESSVRRTGRFAVELMAGAALVERVRFDFPLLGASMAEEEDVLEAGLVSRVSVRVPAAGRAITARILDRKTRKIVSLPWPASDSGPLPSTETAAAEPAGSGAGACTTEAPHCEDEADGGD